MLAIVAPGQGAQTPGFVTPWLELDEFANLFGWLSAVSGIDLVAAGTVADAETIRDTAIAQPLLVAAGLAAAATVQEDVFASAAVVAGHSVGELTAAAGVGALSPEQALILVRERGLQMAAASAVQPTSMTAVIGGVPEEVLAAIEAAGLTAANNNGTGQVVAAGTLAQLEALSTNPPKRARLIPLSVAGAFHTEHMRPAVAHLEKLVRGIAAQPPKTKLLSNSDGAAVAAGSEFLAKIVSQVANPVRWDRCLASFAELGATGILELPPAGTLTGISKRNLKGVATFALNTPQELPAARDFVAEHTTA